MPETKLLVLSDLHAHDSRFDVPASATAPPSSSGKPSWLDYTDPDNRDRDPIRSFSQLVTSLSLRADYLVLPGDICDKANGVALRQAWNELEELRLAVGASATIATAGNHDMDSRYRGNSYDPTEALKALSPAFPVIDERAHAEYWAYQVTQLTFSDIRFVVVNSAAFHGGAANEIEHGRIAPLALTRLRALLSAPSPTALNVLLCHHHPHPVPTSNAQQDDRMFNGECLIDCLDGSAADWLVIHGHRHMAQLVYAAGSASSPAVLAAGSMSVRLDPPLSTLTRNQAHLVTLSKLGDAAELCGIVESWNYNPGIGWESAGDEGGLPQRCGFGYRGSMPQLARRLADAVKSNGGPLSWDKVVSICPEVQYLTPRDFQRVRMHAERQRIKIIANGNSAYEVASL